MTTTRTTTDQASKTTAVIALAAQLYTTATELAGQPLVGSGTELSELNYRWTRNAVSHLHQHLVLNAEYLDAEWTEMIAHTASEEAFDAYGA